MNQRSQTAQELRQKLEIAEPQAHSVVRMPRLPYKQPEQQALAPAWTGEERPSDNVLRMKMDSLARVKKERLGPGRRLLSAKEDALDYTLQKHTRAEGGAEPETGLGVESETDARAEIRERWMGVAQLGPVPAHASLNMLSQLADRKIEESRARGEFDTNPLRGQKTEQDPHTSNGLLDLTDYYVNNILKRQDLAPVWVESQGAVIREVAMFRAELDRAWERWAVSEAVARGGRHIDVSPAAFETGRKDYLSKKVELLNSQLRLYNLQSPLSLQRPYLDLAQELQECYARVETGLAGKVEEAVAGNTPPPSDRFVPPQRQHRQREVTSVWGDMWREWRGRGHEN